MHDRTIFPSLVGAFLFRFKKIAKLKGIPEEDVRRDLYRKKACMQNLFCCDEHIPNSIHYVVQAPCEFSFLDMGPSKCKGVEQNQAPGLSLLGFPWPNNMQYCLLIWTWWMQVIQDTNFNLLRSFLEKFTVCFPTAKEAQASVLLLVGGFNPSIYGKIKIPKSPASISLVTLAVAFCTCKTKWTETQKQIKTAAGCTSCCCSWTSVGQ